MVRADRPRRDGSTRSRDIVVATRAGVPVRVRDIAEVKIGAQTAHRQRQRTGHEVVVGTALMLIGANSRTVAAAVDAKIEDIRRTLPPDIAVKTVLNRTAAGRRHDRHGRARISPRARCW